MTDIEKVRRAEYKSHLLQVKTCKALMEEMLLVAGNEDLGSGERAAALRDLSVAVANVGGRVPQ